jgi:hypothetical protein
MYTGKYGAVIGLNKPMAWNFGTGNVKNNAFLDQSQRRIAPYTSKHGISPNDNVNYSG